MANDGDVRGPVQPLIGVKPPIVLLALIAIGVAVKILVPVDALPEGGWQFIGVPIALAGLAVALFANATFHRIGTDDRFASPTKTIVDEGAFSFSRNPMYVGMVLITLGVMLSINSAASLLVLPVLVLYLQFGVIRREEVYLERWFGEEYLSYKAKVRRWL